MKTIWLAIALLLCAATAQAELSQSAARTEDFARQYARSTSTERLMLAEGIRIGFEGGFEISQNKSVPVPQTMSIYRWLDFCYAEGHCMHVAPGAIAFASLGSTPELIEKSLLMVEQKNTQ